MPQTEILIFSFDFSETIFRSNLENRSKSECHFLTFGDQKSGNQVWNMPKSMVPIETSAWNLPLAYSETIFGKPNAKNM